MNPKYDIILYQLYPQLLGVLGMHGVIVPSHVATGPGPE